MIPFTKPGANEPYPVMAAKAVKLALADARVDYDKVQQAYVGYVYGDSTCGQRALYEVGMTGIPVVNVNNNCSTGSTALYLARQAVQSGAADCVLALGFEQMKPGALFVNAGRGRTVDTDALLAALRSGRIRAALDVTDPEPLPADHPLWRAPNVLITPHVAGNVAREESRAYRFAGEQIRRYASGEPLVGIRAGNMPAGRRLAH